MTKPAASVDRAVFFAAPTLRLAVGAALMVGGLTAAGQTVDGTDPIFRPIDVFSLEYASDPQLPAQGASVVYTRVRGDIMTDRFRRSLWRVDPTGRDHRPVAAGEGDYANARWAPESRRLLYTATEDGRHELRVLYVDSPVPAVIATLPHPAGSPAWSPDGARIAFTMFVEDEPAPTVKLPPKPEGAAWAPAPVVVDEVTYRRDGSGYTTPGHTHIFVVDAQGGTPVRLTTGDADHNGPLAWRPDGSGIVFSASFEEEAERLDPIESDLYEVGYPSGAMSRLTSRDGPDAEPAFSPDGRYIAYTGHDDRGQAYHVSELYVLDTQTGQTRSISPGLDRTVEGPAWSPDGDAVYAMYTDRGVGLIARFGLDGVWRVLGRNVGGTDLGRPYGGGSFTVGQDGVIATVTTDPTRPADVSLFYPLNRGPASRLTNLNEDVLGGKIIPGAEGFTARSSHDGQEIQAWAIRPPSFDAGRRYPMILEIHGGPHADYGPRFSAEFQLYAAEGYFVVYANPRGSTGYGEKFGNSIHNAYPGYDYDDLMSVVDTALERYPIDPDRLFVTGGSGGGVLTAWIVGKTDRFAGAAVQKPVINWASFALTADAYPFFTRYWFPAMPWEEPEHYWERSPLSLVGNVRTPTMLITGEADYRTPISETEQYYQALRLRGVPTRMVRIPGASHGIASRPSRLVGKVSAILEWFGAQGSE